MASSATLAAYDGGSKAMAKSAAITPKWIDRALQGIAYWIGHRRALYSGYSLGESALVAELCNMIFTHLPKEQLLRCEVQYVELLSGTVTSTLTMTRARADIVILRKPLRKGATANAEYVIEVKRASSSNAMIDNDLRRLAAVKRTHPSLVAYLVVIAEADRPKRFVTEAGSALTTIFRIPDTNQLYRVRRVLKASHSFKNPDRAQYACLIEVSPPMPKATIRRHAPWSAQR